MKQLYQKLLTLGLMTLLFFTAGNVMGQVFITEIADPNNDATARYVELYNAGATPFDLFANNYALARFTNGNVDVSLPVKGLTGVIPSGGYYIVATDLVNFNNAYGIDADEAIGSGGPADSNGDDQILLVDTTSFDAANLVIIDIFGVPGEDGSGTAHEFEDGRAERKSTVTTGSSTWDVNEWDVDNDSGGGAGPIDAPAGFDPGAWVGDASVPIFANSTPSASDVLEASFGLNVEFNERSNVYYVVLTDGATSPNAAEVKAGTGNGGSAAIMSGNFYVNNLLSATETVTGLTASTAYDVYVVAEDLSANLTALQTVIDVTTTANVAPSISGQSTAVAETANDIVLSMSENVTVTDATGFSVSIGGAAATVTGISGTGTNELTLTITENIYKNSAAVTISYDNTAGNVTDGTFDLETATDVVVTNNATLNIVANLEAARAFGAGELVQVSGELTVTYIRNSGSTLYAQDATRGIIIQDDNSNLTTTYAVGDVIANVKGAINVDFTNVLEIIPVADLGAAANTGVVIAPQLVAITELNTNFATYESRVISLEGVGFANAGTAFDAGGDNYNIGFSGDTTIFRDNFFEVRYESDVFIPYSTKDIVGLGSQFQGEAQIVPFSSTEAILDNYSPVIDGDATPADTTTSSFKVTVSFDEPAKVQYLVNTSVTATQADVLASATMVQVNNPADSAMISVTGLDDNTQYYVHIVATDTTDANPQAAVTTVGAKTFEIIFDATSDILEATAPIAAATISAATNAEADAVDMFNFKVTDDNATDTEATTINTIVIKNDNATTWSSVLAGASITDGTAAIAGVITDTEITFDASAAPYVVTGGGELSFTVSAWLASDQTDGTELSFTIPTDHAFQADAAGSVIQTTLAAAVTSATHTIDVIATELVITAAPTSVQTDEVFGFSVAAEDDNGNIDTVARQLTASTAASGILGGTLAGAMTDGVYTYADLTYDTEGAFAVSVTDGALTAATANITATATITGGVFFSEYAEGSGNNKYVEIYNGTNVALDLSTVDLKQGNNGAGFDGHPEFPAAYSITLEGTLAPGDVYIVYNGQASLPEILAEGDTAFAYGDNPGDRIAAFNGDDAMGLFVDGILVDLIGDPAVDPGSAWDAAGVTAATTNHTMVRKTTITVGNTTALASFGTTAEDSEWVVYDQDVVTFIGFAGELTDPTITASTTNFNGAFGFVANGSSSEASSYVVSAVNLTTDLVVSAPAGFELSVNADFSSPSATLTIVPTTGDVADTTIYVRFTPVAADGATYSGNIIHASTEADTIALAVSGLEGAFQTSTIADVRANNASGDLVKVTGIVIGGVTHSSASRVIYDGTAGITVRGFDFPTADLVVGDSIVIEGTLSEFANLLQLEPTAAITVVAQGVALPSPQVKTLTEIDESVEGELVLVQNVRFVETGLFAGGGGDGNFRVANDVGDTLTFRIGSSSHPLVDTAIPTEYVNITAWIGQFNDDYQLSPETAAGIEIVPAEPELVVAGAADGFDFGSVEAGTASAAQSFTVAGTNLSADIVITAPAAYEVSDSENGTYATTVTAFVDQAGEVVETTVFVRFAPAASVTGAVNGDLAIATGDLAQSVAVTATATEPVPTANKQLLTGIVAYPNPTAAILFVDFAENNASFNYQVFSLNGTVLVRGKATNGVQINLSTMETGIYLLEVTQGDKIFRSRIAKN